MRDPLFGKLRFGCSQRRRNGRRRHYYGSVNWIRTKCLNCGANLVGRIRSSDEAASIRPRNTRYRVSVKHTVQDSNRCDYERTCGGTTAPAKRPVAGFAVNLSDDLAKTGEHFIQNSSSCGQSLPCAARESSLSDERLPPLQQESSRLPVRPAHGVDRPCASGA